MQRYSCPSALKEPFVAPAQAETMQRFIDTEDFSILEKPLTFARDESRFKQLMCCQAALGTVLACGLDTPLVPLAACCPNTYTDDFQLTLDQDAVSFQTANNDCCCHVAKTRVVVPLHKVQRVELESNCVLSCFGLKAVNVRTAEASSLSCLPQLSAVYVKEPEKACKAIQLAVKLNQQALVQKMAVGSSTGSSKH